MVEVNNLTKTKVNKKFLKEIAKKVLEKESVGRQEKGLEVSIALVEPKKIKELNKRYRGKNQTTDVLSFSYNNSGEIIICPKEVKKNSKRFSSNFQIELTRVLIHGLLHLLGFHHQSSKEKKYLSQFYG